MPASDEAETAMKAFRPAPGFKVELFAAEPHVANISGFDVAADGRFYVVEVFRRRGGGVLDMRTLPAWLDDDLASRSVADRVAMVKRRLPTQDLRAMELESDRVRVVRDRDGDGRADHATVFADRFNKLEDGTAAGVLALRDDIYFANIPNLWLLRDENRDGTADVRKALHSGFGVHYNISGHDLHGLRLGPDGRVYFSVGDRGLHIVGPDGKVVVSNPESGAVLRCEPDGSRLELVHTGLRNPQDLAFDEYGNLFTGDNNSDGGDATRWVYVVEGGDSGWRTGYQWHDFPASRGPWNNERLWDVKSEVPAAYIVPPLANPAIPGPAGLTYTPGTGMPPDWQGRFLLVDFRGGASNSGIWALQNKSKGASFELVETKKLIWGVLPTDVEFGYDGAVYFSDWVDGWVPMGKGRIYRVVPTDAGKDGTPSDLVSLISDAGRATQDELLRRLEHADVRVRTAAQFALAEQAVLKALGRAANGQHPLARMHGVWGLGQINRKTGGEAGRILVGILNHADPEVVAQSAKALGEAGAPERAEALRRCLHHPAERVRFFAAISLGKLHDRGAVPDLVAMLRANAGRDAYLHHAGVVGLAGCAEPSDLLELARDESAVRVAAVVALRRQGRAEVARYLQDQDPLVVLEAARAINDAPIDAATDDLAALASQATGPGGGKVRELIWMRALNANFRRGTAASAAVLAAFAKREDVPTFLRVEALKMLADWDKAATRDRVTGVYHPLQARDPQVAYDAVRPLLPGLLRNAPDAVRVAAAGLVGVAGLKDTAILSEIVRDSKFSGEARAAALEALAGKGGSELAVAVEAALNDKSPALRRSAIQTLTKVPDGVRRLRTLINSGSPHDQQAAFAAMGSLGAAAEPLLLDSLDRLLAGKVAPEARLDLVTAAEAQQSSPAVAAKVKQYRSTFPKDDPMAAHRDVLAGGDADRGRRIFLDRADVQCVRCHTVIGAGGAAGPDLSGIGKRQQRDYLLESILFPAKRITPGWETVVVRLKSGHTLAGVLKSEDAKEVVLIDPEKGELRVPKGDITGRRGGQSAMPPDIANPLSKHDLRDLVEFLASLK